MNEKNKSKIDEHDYIRNKIFDKNKSTIERYADLVIGKYSVLELFKYELLNLLFGYIPGALGLALRKIFYPFLFKKIGKGVIFGRAVTFRHSRNIKIGNNVIFDDYCEVDAHGAGKDGITLNDNVIINRFASVKAKSGGIFIGSHTDIGSTSVVHTQGSPIIIEDMVTVAGGCKVSGGGFQVERTHEDGQDLSDDGNSFINREQQRSTTGPIKIGKKTILGMGVMVLDGVLIGEGCVVGAGSVVLKDLPDYSIAAGVPAKVLKSRK